MDTTNAQEKFLSRLTAGLGAFALVAVAFLAPGAALAQEAHFDVLLYDDGAGNVRAGAIDVDLLAPELGTVAVEGELLGDSTAGTPFWASEDPGYYSLSDTNAGLLGGSNDNLPGGSSVTLDFLVEPTLNISLAYWDDGLGQFGATTGGETLTITKGAINYGSIGGTSTVTGVALDPVSGTGFLDDHPDYVLGTGATGVYLAYVQANVTGFAGPTNPFWLVFGTLDECEETDTCDAAQEAFNLGIEEQIEAGIDYVNLVLVPEPGTALLMGLGLMGLGRAGSRRSRD